jgi:hypothetical protein
MLFQIYLQLFSFQQLLFLRVTLAALRPPELQCLSLLWFLACFSLHELIFSLVEESNDGL